MQDRSLTDDVGFLLSRASGLVVRATNAALAELGLRVRQYSVLPAGVRGGRRASPSATSPPCSAWTPARWCSWSTSWPRAGLVERRPSPSDRRTKLVAATDTGRALRGRGRRGRRRRRGGAAGGSACRRAPRACTTCCCAWSARRSRSTDPESGPEPFRVAEVAFLVGGDGGHPRTRAVHQRRGRGMTSIVRNQWYVAAYGREVGRELFGRTICGEPILFWRTEAGEVTAMSDRCVHRRFPLSESPEPPGRRHRRLRLPRLHLRLGRRVRRRARPDPGPAHRPADGLPGGGAGQLRLGVDRRPGPGRRQPHPARTVAGPGRLDRRSAAWSRSPPGRACWSTT